MGKSRFPRITRHQARAVKHAADVLTKADKIYAKGQEISSRVPAKRGVKLKVPTIDELIVRHWAVYDGIINGDINARTGLELLEHAPLGHLRLIESRERDNGRRKHKKVKIPL